MEIQHIADAAVVQAERFLKQEQLREHTGTTSELDVLRAEVSLANLRPQQVAAKNSADLAMLDLRRLINVPATQPLRLSTALTDPTAEKLCEYDAAPPERWLAARAAVQSAQRQVRMRELAVKIARNSYLPSISFHMNYGRLLYPSTMFGFNQTWRSDWTAGLSVDVPIFDGLRREARVDEAEVQLTSARLQLAQLREGVELQYEQARGERERAAATISARQLTVIQAQRVYDLTVLRYDKGLATQLEVSDARLGLMQARSNHAQALMDFYVADATLTRALGGAEAAAALRSR
jgi:outer membrane protein TolC